MIPDMIGYKRKNSLIPDMIGIPIKKRGSRKYTENTQKYFLYIFCILSV